jgi:hypothetical protein
VLERLGWRFVRIRGTEFFRNPDETMRPVWARLEQLGISPQATPNLVPEGQDELRQTLIREAGRILDEWRAADQAGGAAAPSTGMVEDDPPLFTTAHRSAAGWRRRMKN